MIIYGSDSVYEKFLLSGHGASHYDAARELPGRVYLPFWVDTGFLSRLNLTSRLSLAQSVNITGGGSGSPSGSLAPLKVRRLI